MPDRFFPTGSRRDTDEGKPPMSKLPWTALGEVAFVHRYGDSHYGVGNWRKGQFLSTYADSCQRHWRAFLCGEDRDLKSSCYHLAMAAWNTLCALHQVIHSKRYAHLDDRIDDFGNWVNAEFAKTETARELERGDQVDRRPENVENNGGGHAVKPSLLYPDGPGGFTSERMNFDQQEAAFLPEA